MSDTSTPRVAVSPSAGVPHSPEVSKQAHEDLATPRGKPSLDRLYSVAAAARNQISSEEKKEMKEGEHRLPATLSASSPVSDSGRQSRSSTDRRKIKTGTRATKSASAINASVADAHAQAAGARDALREIKEDSKEEKKPEGPINPQPDSAFIPSCGPSPILDFSAQSHRVWWHAILWVPTLIVAGAGFNKWVVLGYSTLWLVLWGLLVSRITSRHIMSLLDDSRSYAGLSLLQFQQWIEHNPVGTALSPIYGTLAWVIQSMALMVDPRKPAITGVVFTLREHTVEPTVVDTRAPNQAGCKPCPMAATVVVQLVASLRSSATTLRLTCPLILSQIVPRMLCLPRADREMMAKSMASRTVNVVVPAQMASALVTGNAAAALEACQKSDLSSAVMQEARTTSTVSVPWWYYTIVLIVFPLLQAYVAVVSSSMVSAFRHATGIAYFALSPTLKGIFLNVVVFAPLWEEAAKSAISWFRVPRPIISSLFGLWEWSTRGFSLLSMPAFIMHQLVGLLNFRAAVLVHALFNLCVSLPSLWFIVTTPQLTGPDLRDLCDLFSMDPLYWLEEPRIIDAIVSGFDPSLACAGASTVLAFASAAILLSTTVSVGYRIGDSALPHPGAHGADVTILPAYFEHVERRPQGTALGFIFPNVSPPFPDLRHPPTSLHGTLSRFCKNPPPVAAGVLKRMRRFVKKEVAAYPVIPADADLTVPTWLAHTHYPEWRKQQLLNVWNDAPWVEDQDKTNKSFIKAEFYGDFKAARGINSRTDKFKCASGPAFHLMETIVYHNEPNTFTNPFIKHVPVHKRPEYVQELVGKHSGPYYETDYSQFEKHFTPEIMDALELQLYAHMLVNHPELYQLIRSALRGTNICKYKGFIIKIAARRMSGDMCTSLGNGFSNLMLMKFAASRKGATAEGVVEGDDGLFACAAVLSQQDFADLGFDIKIVAHDDLVDSAFCGMSMSCDGILLRDPRRVLPKFGWSLSERAKGGARVRRGLLHARALSLAYESPRCPLMWAVAEAALRATSDVAPIFDNSYHQQNVARWAQINAPWVREQLLLGPTLQSRVDFAQRFGVPVVAQRELERRFLAWDGSDMVDPLVDLLLGTPGFHRFSQDFVFRSAREAAACVTDDAAGEWGRGEPL